MAEHGTKNAAAQSALCKPPKRIKQYCNSRRGSLEKSAALWFHMTKPYFQIPWLPQKVSFPEDRPSVEKHISIGGDTSDSPT